MANSAPARLKRVPKFLEVLKSVSLSPNMQRITFTGEDLRHFPVGYEGGHIKLLFPGPGQSIAEFRQFMIDDRKKSAMRTYTVRAFRQDSFQLDVDFVVHGDAGLAGPWAANAKQGDVLAFRGPGVPKLIAPDANYFLIAADMTAIPAAASGLETLPGTAKGDAYFEIFTNEDIQPVNAPAGINIHWCVPEIDDRPGDVLIRAMESHDQLPSKTSVFVAGEFQMVAHLRDRVRNFWKIEKGYHYVSSYWKQGLVEDDHRTLKNASVAA